MGGVLYIFDEIPLAACLNLAIDGLNAEETRDAVAVQAGLFNAVHTAVELRAAPSLSDALELSDRTWLMMDPALRVKDQGPRFIDIEALAQAMASSPVSVFDPSAWIRQDAWYSL